MNNNEQLLKEHMLSSDEEFVKEYEKNPPMVEEKLQWQPGEIIISELPPKDLAQVLSRYLNNISVYNKNMLHLLLCMERLLTWLCEERGIDVAQKFKEDARAQAELMEARIQASKKALENSPKKN